MKTVDVELGCLTAFSSCNSDYLHVHSTAIFNSVFPSTLFNVEQDFESIKQTYFLTASDEICIVVDFDEVYADNLKLLHTSILRIVEEICSAIQCSYDISTATNDTDLLLKSNQFCAYLTSKSSRERLQRQIDVDQIDFTDIKLPDSIPCLRLTEVYCRLSHTFSSDCQFQNVSSVSSRRRACLGDQNISEEWKRQYMVLERQHQAKEINDNYQSSDRLGPQPRDIPSPQREPDISPCLTLLDQCLQDLFIPVEQPMNTNTESIRSGSYRVKDLFSAISSASDLRNIVDRQDLVKSVTNYLATYATRRSEKDKKNHDTKSNFDTFRYHPTLGDQKKRTWTVQLETLLWTNMLRTLKCSTKKPSRRGQNQKKGALSFIASPLQAPRMTESDDALVRSVFADVCYTDPSSYCFKEAFNAERQGLPDLATIADFEVIDIPPECMNIDFSDITCQNSILTEEPLCSPIASFKQTVFDPDNQLLKELEDSQTEHDVGEGRSPYDANPFANTGSENISLPLHLCTPDEVLEDCLSSHSSSSLGLERQIERNFEDIFQSLLDRSEGDATHKTVSVASGEDLPIRNGKTPTTAMEQDIMAWRPLEVLEGQVSDGEFEELAMGLRKTASLEIPSSEQCIPGMVVDDLLMLKSETCLEMMECHRMIWEC